MVTKIDRDDVQRLMADGAVLVEVLPAAEYAEEHIAGAINLPLGSLTREAAASLERDGPVIVYCYDGD